MAEEGTFVTQWGRVTFGICFILSFLFFGITAASAATLSFSPESGAYAVGDSFSVSAFVASTDQAMNAAEAIIDFPADKLEVTSLSKAGSAFTLWAQEPTFSNGDGTAHFEGVVVNPGYQGPSAKAITVNFKVKAIGTASIAFRSGAVYANDGQGTNILASVRGATFSLGPVSPESTTPGANGTPAAPRISSPTHPDPNSWYSNPNPTFQWDLPSDVTGVSYIADKNPTTDPGTQSDGLISTHSYHDLSDGVRYFHVRLRNKNGWGGISHFRFQIDTQAPDPFVITFPHGDTSNDPRQVVLFNTTDSGSGIDHYEVKIGDGQAFKVSPGEIVGSNPYVLPPQDKGQHTILVRAVDKAGNNELASTEFTVNSLDAPKITSYPTTIKEGDLLRILGETYPDVDVTVSVRDERGKIVTQISKSNGLGNFTLTWPERLIQGPYTLWAQVEDQHGAKSAQSQPLTFEVTQPILLWIGSIAFNYISILLILLLLAFGLLFLAWYLWHRFVLFRRRLKKEIHKAEMILHNTFDSLKERVQEQLKLLEIAKTKRDLTTEEAVIVKTLKKSLDDAEAKIEKEIQDMRDEL